MKYDYNFFPENSSEKFEEACELVSKCFPDAIKQTLLVDVDGSLIQMFTLGESEIVVYDDYDVGAVYIKSDIPMQSIFNKTA